MPAGSLLAGFPAAVIGISRRLWSRQITEEVSGGFFAHVFLYRKHFHSRLAVSERNPDNVARFDFCGGPGNFAVESDSAIVAGLIGNCAPLDQS